MTQILRQSTAVDVLIGPFVDKTDGATAETGESPSVKLSKNGQTLAAKSDVTTPVHDADGYYNCELDATDTNTVGTMVLTVAASANALPVRHEYQVIEEAVYDAMYAASAEGPLQGTTVGNKLDVTATGAAGIDWGNVENQSTSVNLSATTTNLVNTTTTNTDMRGTDSALLASSAPTNFGDMSITATTGLVDITQTAADKAWSTAARTVTAATNITSDASAITMSSSGVVGTVNLVNTTTTNTDMRGTDSAFLAASAPTNFSDLSITATTGRVDVASIEGSDATDQINAACDTSIETYGLDHLVSAAVIGTDVTDNSIFAKLVSSSATADWDTFVNTTDSLQAVRDKQTDIETDTQDIQSRLPSALVGGKMDSDMTAISGDTVAADNMEADYDGTGYNKSASTIGTVTSCVNMRGTDNALLAASAPTNFGDLSITATTGRIDVGSLAGDSTSASNLSSSALGIVTGACEGTPSTTSIQTDLAETTDDHYNGRVVVFTSGSAAGQATDITDYTGSTGTLTVTALTTAPAAADTFVIV